MDDDAIIVHIAFTRSCTFRKYAIIEIQVDINNSYAKTSDNKPWLRSGNTFGQCALEMNTRLIKQDDITIS